MESVPKSEVPRPPAVRYSSSSQDSVSRHLLECMQEEVLQENPDSDVVITPQRL